MEIVAKLDLSDFHECWMLQCKNNCNDCRSSVCHVLHNHLVSFASLLYSDNLALAKVAMEIVNEVGLPEKRDIAMITKLCAATVVLLLHSLLLTGE